jgi:hypothetical protein
MKFWGWQFLAPYMNARAADGGGGGWCGRVVVFSHTVYQTKNTVPVTVRIFFYLNI